jgi:KTSC domain-containing protein
LIEWIDSDSSFIEAIAYDVVAEVIYLRFRDGGAEWAYEYCSAEEWEQLNRPGQSAGKYFHAVLKHKPNHRSN